MKAILLLALVASAAAAQSKAQYINDNNVLNYALTLENLESEFYAQGLAKFNSDSFFTAAGYPTGTYNILNFISGQEASHAAALAATLNARKYPAVTKCNYNFAAAYTDAKTFLQYVTIVEGTGTAAYDGAAGALTDSGLLTIAAGIATIEARHTSALQILFNNSVGSSWPGAFENAKTEGQVFDAVKGFFVNCTAATLTTDYAGTVSVISTDPSTYTWQSAASLRGGNDDNFYYSNSALATADLSVLQYALFLENLEANFYATFNQSYTAAAILADSNYANFYNQANASIVANSIGAIAAHEATHVATLNSILSGYKATPAAPCAFYNWTALGLPNTPTATNPTFTQFLSVAAQLENAGVQAYVGAIALISDSFTAATAATIATIEARHAAYILSILNKNPPYFGTDIFPTNDGSGVQGDAPRSPADTVAIIAPVLGNCAATTNANPKPFVGSNQPFDFFSDKAGPSVSSTSSSPATPSTTARGNSGSVMAVSLALLAAILALL